MKDEKHGEGTTNRRLAPDAADTARVSANGRRACRKAGAERGGRPRKRGATAYRESRIVLELHAASVPHTDL